MAIYMACLFFVMLVIITIAFLKESQKTQSAIDELKKAEELFDELDKIKNKVEYVTIPAYQTDDMDYLDQIRAIGENKYWIFFIEELKRKCAVAISTLDNESYINRSKSGLIGIKYIEDGIKDRTAKYEELNEKV